MEAVTPHGEGKSPSEGGRLPAMTTPLQVLHHPHGCSQARAVWKLTRFAKPKGPQSIGRQPQDAASAEGKQARHASLLSGVAMRGFGPPPP